MIEPTSIDTVQINKEHPELTYMCHFCARSLERVDKLVSSPEHLPWRSYICDDCVDHAAGLCFDEPQTATDVYLEYIRGLAK